MTALLGHLTVKNTYPVCAGKGSKSPEMRGFDINRTLRGFLNTPVYLEDLTKNFRNSSKFCLHLCSRCLPEVSA